MFGVGGRNKEIFGGNGTLLRGCKEEGFVQIEMEEECE